MSRSKLSRFSTSGKIFTVSISAYLLGLYLHARKEKTLKFKVALSRRMSRFTGHCCNMPLPPYLRKYVYLAFGKLYGVNFDDILINDLNDFRTFN